MGGTGNQIILQILGQLHKIRAVACNPHNQIAVLLRLLLCRQQRLTIDDIELHMPQVQITSGTNEGNQLVRPFPANHAGRAELDIQKPCRPVPEARILGGIVGKQHRRRTLFVIPLGSPWEAEEPSESGV